jgi:hypothetical protein
MWMRRSLPAVLLLCAALSACDKPKSSQEIEVKPSPALDTTPLVIKVEPAVLEPGEREVSCITSPAVVGIVWEHNGQAAGQGQTVRLVLKPGDEVACVVGAVRAASQVTRATLLVDTQTEPDTLRHARRVATLKGTTLVLGRDDAGLYGLWRLEHASGALAQVMPLPGGPLLVDPVVVGDRALFLLPVGEQRLAWVSDGTPQGSLPLSLPGGAAPGQGGAALIAGCGDRALIAGVDSAGQSALWETDGTSLGTKLVRALSGSARWEQVRCQGEEVSALARDGRLKFALWTLRSGQGEGLERERAGEVVVGVLPPLPGKPAIWWERDEQTLRLLTAQGADDVELGSWPADEAERLSAWRAGADLVFVVQPPVIDQVPWQAPGRLWTTDGTRAGTRQVDGLTEPVALREASGAVFALGERAIWRVVSAREQTLVATVAEGSLRRDTKSLLDVGGRLVFVVERGEEALVCQQVGVEPARCAPGCADEAGLCAEALVAGQGERIWVAEGSPASSPQGWRNGLVVLEGDAYKRVALERTMSGLSPATQARLVGGVLHFMALGGARGDTPQRWITDGTVGGTRREAGELPARGDFDRAALRIAEGLVSAAGILIPERPAGLPLPILPYGSTKAVALGMHDGKVGLWLTDGSKGGTRLIMASGAGQPRIELPLGIIGDKLVFVATDPVRGAEPWVIGLQ